MKTLERQLAYDSFLEQLRTALSCVLLLDYDGTLAPFNVDRSLAFPYPQVPALIARVMEQGTRVVLISGRPAREVLLLSRIHPQPEVWGSHGLERLHADGSYEVAPVPHEQHEALSRAARVLRMDGLSERLETKPGGIAVHWRGLGRQTAVQIEDRVRRLCRPLLADCPLDLLEFDGGLEIRVPGRDKGAAVSTILGESDPNAAVAYLGDDQTDEDAFQALKGRGLTVLVRPQSRATMADVWLQPPQELIRFLEDWLQAAGGQL
jgi:trehalose 6-phosphate phosphatase